MYEKAMKHMDNTRILSVTLAANVGGREGRSILVTERLVIHVCGRNKNHRPEV